MRIAALLSHEADASEFNLEAMIVNLRKGTTKWKRFDYRTVAKLKLHERLKIASEDAQSGGCSEVEWPSNTEHTRAPTRTPATRCSSSMKLDEVAAQYRAQYRAQCRGSMQQLEVATR